MTEPDGYEFGAFELGLSPDDEARARRLHDDSIVIDLLYWGPVSYRSFDDAMEKQLRASYAAHHNTHLSVFEAYEMPGRFAAAGHYPHMQDAWAASGVTGGHFPMFVGSEGLLVRSAAHLTRMVGGLPWVRKVTHASDFVEAKKNGQLAFFGQCQPSVPISRDLSLIEQAHALGLRMLMLTYNDQDFVGAGCTDRTDAGVSNFGRRVIERCNDLGIIVDTGHCGRRTTLDACEFSSTPVVASHTAAAGVYEHDRGKSDEELQAIAATGGVIGIVTVPFFLAPLADASLTTWLDHVDYVARLVGVEHVAIGTDWPMAGPKWTMSLVGEYAHTAGFRPEDHGTGDVAFNLPGFDDYRDFPNFTRGLVSRGYSDDEIRGILGGNALRVFEKVIG